MTNPTCPYGSVQHGTGVYCGDHYGWLCDRCQADRIERVLTEAFNVFAEAINGWGEAIRGVVEELHERAEGVQTLPSASDDDPPDEERLEADTGA